MTAVEWVMVTLGSIVAAVTAGTVIYMGKVISELGERFVPRDQANRRFESIERRVSEEMNEHKRRSADMEARIHTDMKDMQLRTDNQFDATHRKLDWLVTALSGKADR